MKGSSLAANDLGLGDGDTLSTQVDAAEEERKKRLLKLANDAQGGPASMGLAAFNLLGNLRG